MKNWTKKEEDILQKYYNKFGPAGMVRENVLPGRSYKSIQHKASKMNVTSELTGRYEENLNDNEKMKADDGARTLMEQKVLNFLKGKRRTILEVCEHLDKSPTTVKQLLKDLADSHYNVNIKDDEESVILHESAPSGNTIKFDVDKYFGSAREVTFGIISDLHYCNIHSRHEIIEHAYDNFKKEGVPIVLEPGNMVDGEAPFNKYELLAWGIQGQAEYLVEHAPQREGVTTYFITGEDHEGWLAKRSGINIGAYFQNVFEEAGRNDWQYLSNLEADVAFHTKSGSTVVRVAHPGGGTSYATCVSSDTEILTNEGWKFFNQLSKEEKVATLNPINHEFQWQKPNCYTDEFYEGEMHGYKARCFDMLLTPSHRLYTRRYGENFVKKVKDGNYIMPQKVHNRVDWGWSFVESDTLKDTKKQKFQMLLAAKEWNGISPEFVSIPVRDKKKYASTEIKNLPLICIDDYVQLAGWYISEGSIDKKLKQVTISQSKTANPNKYLEICKLLDRIGIEYSCIGLKSITISSVLLAEYFEKEFGLGSRNKIIPRWIIELEKQHLLLLLQTMMKGDGWKNSRGVYSHYRSISKKLIDCVQEIAIKIGWGGTINKNGDCISFPIEQNLPTINKKPFISNYKGKIYCVSTDNQIIMIRRNGRAIWTGNSYQPQKIIESLQGGEKPHVFVCGHYHKLGYWSVRNVHTILAGCCEDQTPFARKKHLDFQLGYWIVNMKLKEDGSVLEITPRMFPFFDRKVYQVNVEFPMQGSEVVEQKNKTAKAARVF